MELKSPNQNFSYFVSENLNIKNNSDWIGFNPGSITGCIVWMDFNTSGGVIHDNISNTAGSCFSGVDWVSGRKGSGVAFTGSAYIRVYDNTQIGSNDNYSISFWINNCSGSSDQSVSEHWVSGGGYPWAIRGPYSTSNGRITFSLYAGYAGVGNPSVSSLKDMRSGLHHCVCVRDWINSGSFSFYVDGSLSQIAKDTTDGDVSSSGTGFSIGARFQTTALRFFNGQIDEFSVYNRALTELEIQQLYNFGYPKFKTLSSENETTTINNLNSNNLIIKEVN